ncbi:hypothetical protein [Pseudomonas taiwanensis]|uniref:hypothetical protein n=1 Tax=Pseudomonas taiwanensis TaxID=470150 RepID=UPI0015BA6758|nr:hypothetical protein [Pseudomonas taiwanensis]
MNSLQLMGSGLAKATLLLDPYERQARLYPALLCLLPFAVMAIALYGNQMLQLKGLWWLAGAVGGLYLLSDIARSLGKGKEKGLWLRWGGVPSVQVLRHHDDVLDSVSKRRYHDFLARKLKVVFPSREIEGADPGAADAVYAAAGNWLREATRDKKKFDLLFRANVTYGYRRNGFGVRWLGLLMCLGVVAWVMLRLGLSSWAQRLDAVAHPEALLGAGEAVTIGVALVMAVVWIFYFSEARVREAAFSYAQRLVLACEVLLPHAPTRTAKSGATALQE